MQGNFGKYFYLLICFIFFLFLTLYVSDFLSAQLLHGLSYSNDFVALKYIENRGAAFSILQDSREVLIIGSVVAICLILSYIIRHISAISMKTLFFCAMLAAGIAGNLHERIIFGYVRDYIQLKFVDFPVFNISDIFINLGVLVLIIILLRKNI